MKPIIAFIFTATAFIFITHRLSTSFEDGYNNYKSKVGNKIVLNGDTLMIIDFSFLQDNFKLEDGREISMELLDNLDYID